MNTPPELDLRGDCKDEAEEAVRIATASGVPSLLNIKIIDIWNVQNEGDTWYASTCSADVMFNNGKEAKLSFEMVPRHGKYFLQTQILP